MILRKTHDKNRYDFRDAECLSAACFAPGIYQIRGATLSGSRSTGATRPCCMRRAYHGCPTEVVHLDRLRRERREEGWRIQR